MYSFTTESMQSNSSFCIVFDVPLEMVAVWRCSSSTLLRDATKSTNPLKMPRLSEESVSSGPCNANSKAPQNLRQLIILDKMCVFLSTPLLCYLTAILWQSSSCVAMFTLPNMASLTELSMCALVFSCFLTFSDRCFVSLTPVTVHAGSVQQPWKAK